MSATPTGVVKFSQHHFGYGVFKLIHNSTREYLCLAHLPQLSENLSIFIGCPLGHPIKLEPYVYTWMFIIGILSVRFEMQYIKLQ